MIERLLALSDCKLGIGKHPAFDQGATEFQLLIVHDDTDGTTTVQVALDRDAVQVIADETAKLLEQRSVIIPARPRLAVPRSRNAR